MNCKETRQKLSAYVDGELEEEVVQHLEEHIEACRSCERALELERRFKNEFQSAYRGEKAPFTLRARIRQEIAAREKRRARLRMAVFNPIMGLVAAALVLLILTGVWQNFASRKGGDGLILGHEMELVGTIDCINCYLARKEHIRNYCRDYGHLPALVAETGEVYSFVANDVSADLQNHPELWHKRVRIKGWVFHQANFIELEQIESQGESLAVVGSDAKRIAGYPNPIAYNFAAVYASK